MATKKITVEVPARVLESAQSFTGEGVTETVRLALEELTRRRAADEFIKLRGKIKFASDWRELRGKDEE
jgi:hypothetical protein